MLHYASSLWVWVASRSGFRIIRSYQHTTTAGKTPLYEWSARRRGLYLQNTQQTRQKKKTSGIRTRNPSNQRMQTYAVYRRAIGIGRLYTRFKVTVFMTEHRGLGNGACYVISLKSMRMQLLCLWNVARMKKCQSVEGSSFGWSEAVVSDEVKCGDTIEKT